MTNEQMTISRLTNELNTIKEQTKTKEISLAEKERIIKRKEEELLAKREESSKIDDVILKLREEKVKTEQEVMANRELYKIECQKVKRELDFAKQAKKANKQNTRLVKKMKMMLVKESMNLTTISKFIFIYTKKKKGDYKFTQMGEIGDATKMNTIRKICSLLENTHLKAAMIDFLDRSFQQAANN